MRDAGKTELSPLFCCLRFKFRAEWDKGELLLFKEWWPYFSHTPRGMQKTDLSLLKNSETLKGGNCIVSRVMWAMVKQGDNLFWKHAILVFTQKSRLVTSASSARKNRDVTSRQTIPLQSDNAISSHTVRDAKNRLVTAFLLPAFPFLRRDAEVAQGAQSEIKGSCTF